MILRIPMRIRFFHEKSPCQVQERKANFMPISNAPIQNLGALYQFVVRKPYCVSKLIQSTSCGYRFLIYESTTRYVLFHSSPRTHMILGIVF